MWRTGPRVLQQRQLEEELGEASKLRVCVVIYSCSLSKRCRSWRENKLGFCLHKWAGLVWVKKNMSDGFGTCHVFPFFWAPTLFFHKSNGLGVVVFTLSKVLSTPFLTNRTHIKALLALKAERWWWWWIIRREIGFYSLFFWIHKRTKMWFHKEEGANNRRGRKLQDLAKTRRLQFHTKKK